MRVELKVGGKIVGNVVGPRPGVSRAMRPPVPGSSDNLSYNGGRIMVEPHLYSIYWVGDNTANRLERGGSR